MTQEDKILARGDIRLATANVMFQFHHSHNHHHHNYHEF